MVVLALPHSCVRYGADFFSNLKLKISFASLSCLLFIICSCHFQHVARVCRKDCAHNNYFYERMKLRSGQFRGLLLSVSEACARVVRLGMFVCVAGRVTKQLSLRLA